MILSTPPSQRNPHNKGTTVTKKNEKKPAAPKPPTELPLGDAPGVAPLVIDDIEKAIAKYEKAKNKRVAESPAEIAYKRELRQLLHAHREQLHTDPETREKFYRFEGKDYVLTEKLAIRKVESDDSPTVKEVVD